MERSGFDECYLRCEQSKSLGIGSLTIPDWYQTANGGTDKQRREDLCGSQECDQDDHQAVFSQVSFLWCRGYVLKKTDDMTDYNAFVKKVGVFGVNEP